MNQNSLIKKKKTKQKTKKEWLSVEGLAKGNEMYNKWEGLRKECYE